VSLVVIAEVLLVVIAEVLLLCVGLGVVKKPVKNNSRMVCVVVS
jgi:hypothetical protein